MYYEIFFKEHDDFYEAIIDEEGWRDRDDLLAAIVENDNFEPLSPRALEKPIDVSTDSLELFLLRAIDYVQLFGIVER
jgi:hypothetical protein